ALPALVGGVAVALRAVAQRLHLALGAVADLALLVGLRAGLLQLRQVGLQLLLAGLDLRVARLLYLLALHGDAGLPRRQVAGAPLGLHPGAHVVREVDDLPVI